LLLGRPTLTACVDAYSSLCLGYSLSWEGGVYSLKELLCNIIADKKELCSKHGILIQDTDWDVNKLPSTFITDRGVEYVSIDFGNITELGVKVINLPSYRAELKGPIEKFFDLVQDKYKDALQHKGTIHLDFKKRGGNDYRKDACLTLYEFETVILHCIIYYNTKRLLENFPYTEEMLNDGVKPFANEIWNYNKSLYENNLINANERYVVLSLLPRTVGRFTREGLKVNGLRYKNDLYSERFLSGGTAEVAYDCENVSKVWLIEGGCYVDFYIIEKRYSERSIREIENMKKKKRQLMNDNSRESLQGEIDLNSRLEAIRNTEIRKVSEITNVLGNKKIARQRAHKVHTKEF